ncbi:response regulator [Sulfurimonas aquatica]|uniref:Response regulator n=1 Tax=Sulfurimonas aquatica TaxID=2672570 RepID=A0A975GC65_9BACT|nr:response regulator [Sulfurimonas aquatica]QSZ41406.1 response regulator [Sulfurimonas aquatica]
MNIKESHDAMSNIKLLYVEDEEGIRNQTANFLQKFFTEMDIAEDGEAGLELFSKKLHDLVITDLKMPKMSGKEMLSKIVALKPDTITVVMSGISSDSDIKKDEVDFFIDKPASLDTLLQMMEVVSKKMKV